ncbi:MAG TPA: hypothetical protein VF057_00740 [Thermoanaerobaculia bacterium]
MRRTLAALLCLTFALAGCKAKEALDAANISEELQDKGTTELMNEAAEDSYDPPADGKLTDAQVKMYLKVREQEKKVAQVAKQEMEQHAKKSEKKEKSLAGMIEGFKALGSAADLLTADIRAAKQLGYNSQEYLWVKERILEVSGAALAESMNTALDKQMNEAIAQTKKAADEATDEATKKIYTDMLAQYEQSRQEMKQNQNQDPAVAHNRALVSKYENELNAYAAELAKWTGNDAEAQKSVEDWQKKVQEAGKQ